VARGGGGGGGVGGGGGGGGGGNSLGGPIMDHIDCGGPSTGPTPFFNGVVSPCRFEPLRAGCCGGEGGLEVSLE